MKPPGSKGSRWYDRHPQMVSAIDMLEQLPQQFRLIIARGVLMFTDQNVLLGSTEELKSLGHNKVLNLIQSKARRRWYDKDPDLHRAINSILLMKNEDRRNTCYRLVVALEAIEAYTEERQNNGKLVDPQEVEQITNDIFGRNFTELLELTSEVKPEQKKAVTAEEKDKVVEDYSGMKLSALNLLRGSGEEGGGAGEEQPETPVEES